MEEISASDQSLRIGNFEENEETDDCNEGEGVDVGGESGGVRGGGGGGTRSVTGVCVRRIRRGKKCLVREIMILNEIRSSS